MPPKRKADEDGPKAKRRRFDDGGDDSDIDSEDSCRSQRFSAAAKPRSLKKNERNRITASSAPLTKRLTFAAISFEQGHNFATGYKKRIGDGGDDSCIPFAMDSASAQQLLAVDKIKTVSTINQLLKHSFKGKYTPYVLCGIEIADMDAVKINDKDYTLRLTINGKNKKGGLDRKQDFCVYVRNDKLNYFHIATVPLLLPCGAGFISHVCPKICFKIQEGSTIKTYAHMVVHLPNATIGNTVKEAAVRHAVKKYAASQPETYLSFFGDTNMKSAPESAHCHPSMGGMFDGGDTITPRSSGASQPTTFMRVEPITQDADLPLLQPSTLNRAVTLGPLTDLTGQKVGVDHPSIMVYNGYKGTLVDWTSC